MACVARFETPYYTDPVHTAQDAIKAAQKSHRWRVAGQIKPELPPEPEPIQIEPVVIVEAKPITGPIWPLDQHWLYTDPAYDRSNKFPPGFINHIKSLICREFQVTLESLYKDLRSVYIVIPRHVAMYLAKMLTGRSTPDLGHLFHRDHSSILHALHTLPPKLEKDPALRERVEMLKTKLEQDLAKWRGAQ